MNNINSYPIDYALLAPATRFYNDRGFHPIEVPWIIDKAYSLITTTPEKAYATKPSKHFVGSAEQSFLQLALTGKLNEHYRYQAITPCFRRDVIDESHSNWFMKLELFEFCTDFDTNPRLNLGLEYTYFISSAFRLFESLLPAGKVEIVPTEEGSDILVNGVEVGSYGKRHYNNMTWVYGTGIALPRVNYAFNSSMVAIA